MPTPSFTLSASTNGLVPHSVVDFDPKEFLKLADALPEDIELAVDKVLFDVAQEVRSYVRKSVLAGKFNLDPLSPSWAAYKKRRKLDPRILVASRKYIESIDVTQLFGGGGYVVQPDVQKVHPGYVDRPNKRRYTMADIGRIAEYGARWVDEKGNVRWIPARPHWRPTADHFRNEMPRIRNEIEKRAEIEIAARLRATKEAMRRAARSKKTK